MLRVNPRIVSLTLVLGLAATGCAKPGSDGHTGDEQNRKLPKIEVNLPSPPSFKKEHAPESYADGNLSIYGVRKQVKKKINQEVKLKAYILEVYVCPVCPKGAQCKPCDKPHFWIVDRLQDKRDKAMMVTDYPEKDPVTKKKLKFTAGSQYVVTGLFAKRSGTGFSSSEGLLVYRDAQLVEEKK